MYEWNRKSEKITIIWNESVYGKYGSVDDPRRNEKQKLVLSKK